MTEILATRATEPLRPEGRPLYAGQRSLGLPGDPMGDAWRLGDMLREYRGDAHTAAWTSSGFDATEIGLMTELYWGLPPRTYVRSRAWNDEQLDAAVERLRSRGLFDGDAMSAEGRAQHEAVEVATDRQMAAAIDALGDDFDELIEIMTPWGATIREAAGTYRAAHTNSRRWLLTRPERPEARESGARIVRRPRRGPSGPLSGKDGA